MWDEEAPPKPKRLAPLAFDSLGVNEINGYIAELQAEIARAESAIARKRDHRGVADSFFRT